MAVSESAVYNADMSDEKLALIFKILNAFATDDELKSLRNLNREPLWKWDGNGFVPSLASVAGLE